MKEQSMKKNQTRTQNKFWIQILAILTIVTGLLGVSPSASRAASLVVDSGADDAFAHDLNPGNGVCADTHGACTLRAALEEANAFPGADVITFNISQTIYLNEGALPEITDSVMIDASSRWNSTLNQPGVTIDGVNGNYPGLVLRADNCSIVGLEIRNFDGNGIYITSANNAIGHPPDGNSNVIGETTGAGIALVSSAAINNIVLNNYLGVTPSGTKISNLYGVYLAEGAHNNIIGGASEDMGNIIAGNRDGVYIIQEATQNNMIGSNLIGGGTVTLPDGTDVELPGNTRYGVVINSADATQIGGVGIAGNAIVKNGWSGIQLSNGANNTFVSSNAILQNDKHGIYITDSTDTNITGNIIGQNKEDGIRVSGSSALRNLLFGNMISVNTGKGIELLDGANLELAAPVITSASNQGAAGTTCPNCDVYISSDSGDEGQFIHGTVTANAQGNWNFTGTILLQNVTALAVDLNGNTSEYSAPYNLAYQIFLPMVIK
jgi:parallel beta-helix repeat protein